MRSMKQPNTITRIITLLMVSSFALLPGQGLAGPAPGPVFKHVPPGSQRIFHADINYLFHKGRFYKPGKSGYFPAHPPVGLIVTSLPAAAATLVVAGTTYWMYDNIYYKKVPSGYQVVEVSEAIPAESETIRKVYVYSPGARVAVQVRTLNVRSGPGSDHPISCHAYYGNILVVVGNAPDWLYVRLPDGGNGWVMSRFVAVPGTGNPKG